MEKIKQKYVPAPGGRIEFRFRMSEEKYLCDEWIKELMANTGMHKDEILVKALNDFRKKYDEKGNLI